MIRKSIQLLIVLSLALGMGGLSPSAGQARSPGGAEIAAANPASLRSPTATTVSINPSASSVSGCEILEVYLDVNDVSNLNAVDIRLSFNPAVVEVVDFSPGAPVDIEPVIDPNLNFTAGFTVKNEVNNFTGTLWYAATQVAPTPPAAGSGHIARLRLRAKSTASSALTFTYIKLSNPSGQTIPATGVNGSVSASTNVVPSLSISRLNATQVQLSWPVAAGVSRYHLYRSTLPYFFAADPAYQQLTPPTPPATQTFNDTVLGNVSTNYFYALRAECTVGGGKSAASAQVGKFEYALYETTGTDFTWIGLVLELSGISKAQDLANHIQNNSSGSVAVKTISRWNASGQNITTYIHQVGLPNYDVFVRNPYRVEIDLPGVSSGSVIWAQVGRLPAIIADNYTLYETTGTDYTWVLQPLDMTGIVNMNGLANHIQTNSSAPVAVLTISRWNPAGQNYTSFIPGGPINPDTRFGYPYRVEINVNSGFTVTWP